jgi:hypothetical protein
VIMNLLVDHCGIEKTVLALTEEEGAKVQGQAHLWANVTSVRCNSARGPVELTRRAGGSKGRWAWPYDQPPQPLLSQV